MRDRERGIQRKTDTDIHGGGTKTERERDGYRNTQKKREEL